MIGDGWMDKQGFRTRVAAAGPLSIRLLLPQSFAIVSGDASEASGTLIGRCPR